MSKNNLFKKLSLILCMVSIAAMTLFTACGDNKETNNGESTNAAGENQSTDNAIVVGEGEVSFTFTVVDGTGNETVFTINTDKKKVGDALLEQQLIEGEDGPYGLYVKSVNGITVDFDKDGTYWAFYIDGQYAMSGVDTTDIVAGTTYTFKVEK